MNFNKDLKQCETIEDCQIVFNQELKRLQSLNLYKNDSQKLEKRMFQMLTDIGNHMDAQEIKGTIIVPKLDKDKITISKETITNTLTSKKFYTNLLYWLSPLVIVVGLLLTLGSIFQLSKVDGHSMDPTLDNGSYLVFNKYAKLERFDVVVAKELDTNGETYAVVKRIIGMPGDTIEYKNDVLYINGEETAEPYIAEYLKSWKKNRLEVEYSYDEKAFEKSLSSRAFTTQEVSLVNGEVNKKPENFKVEVPITGYFLIGDNRIVSKDSRHVGAFPRENIVGEVVWSGKISKKE